MLLSHNNKHQHPFPPETVTEKQPQETLQKKEQKAVKQNQETAALQKQDSITPTSLQKTIQRNNITQTLQKPVPLSTKPPEKISASPLQQKNIALLNATGKRSEQQPLGQKPDRCTTGAQREKNEQRSTSEAHAGTEKIQQPTSTSNSHKKYIEGLQLASGNTAQKNIQKAQPTHASKAHTTGARTHKEGWFRDRRSAEGVQATDNVDTNNTPVGKKIEWGKSNTMYGDSRGKISTNATNELTIFGKPHDFYRSSLTYVNNDLDENLSILPCTMIPAEPLELEIFTSKVHQALARHLNQQQITVYSPQTTTVPISFDLVSQNNTIIAYVVTKSSGNAHFDSALARVMNILAQAILPPQTDIASHAIAYPFTYSVHFLQGSHKYHVVQ